MITVVIQEWVLWLFVFAVVLSLVNNCLRIYSWWLARQLDKRTFGS